MREMARVRVRVFGRQEKPKAEERGAVFLNFRHWREMDGGLNGVELL